MEWKDIKEMVPKKKGEIQLFKKKDGKNIIFDFSSAMAFVINDIGADMFEHIDGKRRFDKIKEEIKESYDAEEDEIKKDLIEFYTLLREEDVIYW